MTIKFIKLTEQLRQGDTKKLLLPTHRIIHIQQGLNADTHVKLDDKSYYFVVEKVDEIEKLLNGSVYPGWCGMCGSPEGHRANCPAILGKSVK